MQKLPISVKGIEALKATLRQVQPNFEHTSHSALNGCPGLAEEAYLGLQAPPSNASSTTLLNSPFIRQMP
jgi:hypothetical protein